MSHVNQMLHAMRHDCIYRACDISAITRMSNREVNRVMRALAQGGLVEFLPGDGYRRKHLYKTKQREMKFPAWLEEKR